MMAGRSVCFVGLLIVGLLGLLQGANAAPEYYIGGIPRDANPATTYQVGDNRGWTVPPSNQSDYYQQWANNRTFQIGDSLVFNWTAGTHTTTQLGTKVEYDNCTKIGLTFVDPLTITFNENGTYYFLCSVDNHCEQGQKVIIKIGDGVSPPSFAAPSLTTASALSALLISAAVFFFFS